MKEIHKLEEYNYQFLKSLIDNEIEESIHIEFKSKGALSKKDSHKKEISKDVAAFANSDGGILVYGIEEINHKAHGFSFIDGNIFTKEWLEQIISTTVQRKIPNLLIFPIRNEGRISETIYVVQIPSSIEAPHLARDKRYYKRFNFESVQMEEYEIRQLYGRKLNSKLVLDGYNISKYIGEPDDDEYKFMIEIFVGNDGEIAEKEFKVNLHFEEYNKKMNIHWKDFGTNRNYNSTRIEEKTIKVSNIGNAIYPDETITILIVNFDIPKYSYHEIKEKLKFRIQLYYQNGEDKIEFPFKELQFADIS